MVDIKLHVHCFSTMQISPMFNPVFLRLLDKFRPQNHIEQNRPMLFFQESGDIQSVSRKAL